MIQDPATAKTVFDMMMKISGMIDESTLVVRDSCTEVEFLRYRRKAATILGEIFDVVYAIHGQFPELSKDLSSDSGQTERGSSGAPYSANKSKVTPKKLRSKPTDNRRKT